MIMPFPLEGPARATRRTPGFTLIELLVTIAIIAILASLVMGGYRAAGEASRSAKCSSNLRQLAAAFHQFAGENDGRLPAMADTNAAGKHWYTNKLQPYLPITKWRYAGAEIYGDTVDGLYKCPSATIYKWGGGYGVNESHLFPFADKAPDGAGTKLAQITRPAALWLIGDACQGTDPNTTWIGTRCPLNGTDHNPAPRHKSMVNLAFVDGHVESWKPTDLKNNKNDIFGHSSF